MPTTDDLCIEAKSVVKDGDYEVGYLQYKAPWPVSNRDFVMLTWKKVDGNKIYFLNSSIDYPVPAVNGVVRAQIIVGSYGLEKLKDNVTKITYISHSDPKGNIPEALSNVTSKKQSETPHLVYKGILSKK